MKKSDIDKNLLLERDAQIAGRELEKAQLKALLQRALPLVIRVAQFGSHDAELLQQEIEVALRV